MSVLCLIANPSDPVLDDRLARVIQHETHGEINWLCRGVACEIIAPQSADPVAEARGRSRSTLPSYRSPTAASCCWSPTWTRR